MSDAPTILGYCKDSSGFWIATFPTDPQSATITEGELRRLVQLRLPALEALTVKMNRKMDALRAFAKGADE